MKLTDLYQEVATDFPIDISDIANESAKTTDLFIKYMKYWSNESLQMELMETKRKKLINEKREYYSGNAPAEVYKEKPFDLRIKTEQGLQKYIEADDDVIKYDEQVSLQRQKVLILEHCMDEIKRRNWALRVALDDIKFKSGG